MRTHVSIADLVRSYPIARRLPVDFDPAPLADDVTRLGDQWWKGHAGPYHDGGWESVSLWAPNGDPFEQRSFSGDFAATPALIESPAIRAAIEAFPTERNRIRLMRLEPGARILRHSDPPHTIDPRLVRLHVRIVTSDEVVFRVDDRRVRMRAGETWYVDVRFAHSVDNGGARARVHLVMDLTRDRALDDLLARGASAGDGRLVGYFVQQALPGRVRRTLGLDNRSGRSLRHGGRARDAGILSR